MADGQTDREQIAADDRRDEVVVPLQFFYVPYHVKDPVDEVEGFDWIEIGIPQRMNNAAEIHSVAELIRDERYSPAAKIVLLPWIFLRQAEEGEPSKKRMLGDLPPAPDS